MQGEKPIGIVTSGGYGHRVKMPLALAYFRERPRENKLYVDILGKNVKAKILSDPPYDPSNLRMRE